MDDWRADRIGSAIGGTNPTVLASLADLARDEQRQFLSSMATLGEAVETACRAADAGFRRLNYDILGNTDEFLHAHVWPRYDWEPAERVTKPVWLYPPEFWTLRTQRLGPQHDSLRAAITAELGRLGASAG